MNKLMGIAVVVGIAIIIGVIAYQISDTTWKKSSTEEYYESIGKQNIAHVVYPNNPQILGPLQINKDKYVLGENVFVLLNDIEPVDKGQVIFETPTGIIYETLNFDGKEQTSYKKYFKPQLLKGLNLCQKDLLIGEWKVYFRSYEGMSMSFEMTDEVLPNEEQYYEGCNIAYVIEPDMLIQPSEKLP